MPDTLSRRDMLCGATGAALMGFGPIGSALAANPMPITIANASGALNLTMQALMRQQKYLESFNLKPEVLPVADGSKILGAIVSGTVDASLMSGFGQIFPAIEHGARLKVLGGGALAPTTAMFTGKADINSLKDLEGRSVGIGSLGALVHQLVVALLRKQKVDISKVHFVNVGSSADIFRAVSAGTVDAGPAAASMIAVASRYHVGPFRAATWRWNWRSSPIREPGRRIMPFRPGATLSSGHWPPMPSSIALCRRRRRGSLS